MAETPSPVAIARREKHVEYFHNLCEIVFKAKELTSAALDNEQLEYLSVSVLDELDVDQDSPIDFAPRYFSPLPEDALDDWHKSTHDWHRPCRGDNETGFPVPPMGSTLVDRPGCDMWTESCCRKLWLMNVFDHLHDDGLATLTGWEHLPPQMRYDACSFIGDHQRFKGTMQYTLKGGKLPHSSIFVTDTHAAAASNAILRSEIIAAGQFLKEQIRYLQHINHHTIPILLVRFHHDSVSRITQVHFDGERLFLRPSRLLDLASDKPTPDAYRIVRWFASKPVGETAYLELSDPLETDKTDKTSERIPLASHVASSKKAVQVAM